MSTGGEGVAGGGAGGPPGAEGVAGGGAGGPPGACEACLKRSWLLGRLGGHLEPSRGRIEAVLALGDTELIEAVAGAHAESWQAELDRLDVESLRASAARAGIESICRCHLRYPPALRELGAPPAVLHVAGGLERLLDMTEEGTVALVGSRQASPYGLETARALAGGLARAGVTVISGMALGVDAAAHAGALSVTDASTVAVLPGSPAEPYPAAKRALHHRIIASGAVVSEMPLGTPVRRWTFPARNRIIAALAGVTVVVEAGRRSGALVTAGMAARLGRTVCAVPGRITSTRSHGCHDLLVAGAQLVRGPEDILDALLGAGAGALRAPERRPVEPTYARLVAALADGHDPAVAFAQAGLDATAGLAALAQLELGGWVRRRPGGYSVLP